MRSSRPLVTLLAVALALPLLAGADGDPPPTTEFEDSDGAVWTSHQGELDFLAEVAARSSRVSVEEVGRSHEDRPLHLVRLGDPAPRSLADLAERDEPVMLFVCSQHGNEPAGREACLQWLRDLAFTDAAALVRQLSRQTILFVPTANPDGRARDSRGNASGTDINRDHMQLRTPEGQAIARVVRDWRPDVAADLHEYGPSLPVVYDDELLYLWPRNLNVDEGVRALARTLAEDYVAKGAEAAGHSADEYGRYEVLDHHVTQSAGDWDDGIARNLLGLRHVAGILVETAVTNDLRNGPQELDGAEVRLRRVATHDQAIADTLRFMRDLGPAAAATRDAAEQRKLEEGRDRSAPLFFDGQDEDDTLDGQLTGSRAEPTSYADPPPCGYRLTPDQLATASTALELHGIDARLLDDGGGFVSMAQTTEPVVGLLLDGRAERHRVAATPLDACAAVVAEDDGADGSGQETTGS